MKLLIAACGITVMFAADVLAQAPKYGVKVMPEKGVNYAAFKTYSWTQGQPSQDKQIDRAIVAAVDKEMSGLGMSKAASGPGDVLVTYYSLSRTDVNLKAKPDAAGNLPRYSVGTLVVGLLDTGTRKRLLRLRIDKPIEGDRSQLEGTINEAVAALFAQYPTRTKK